MSLAILPRILLASCPPVVSAKMYTQKVAEEFKALIPKQKKTYEAMYKERYRREMATYKPSAGDDDDDEEQNEVKGERKKKNPIVPKRPMTAHALYSIDIRKQVKEENPDFTFAEVVSVTTLNECSSASLKLFLCRQNILRTSSGVFAKKRRQSGRKRLL